MFQLLVKDHIVTAKHDCSAVNVSVTAQDFGGGVFPVSVNGGLSSITSNSAIGIALNQQHNDQTPVKVSFDVQIVVGEATITGIPIGFCKTWVAAGTPSASVSTGLDCAPISIEFDVNSARIRGSLLVPTLPRDATQVQYVAIGMGGFTSLAGSMIASINAYEYEEKVFQPSK